jgi:prolyl 4-hydroxylase
MDRVTVCASPFILLLKGFLSPEECAHLIELAKARLQGSTVVSNDSGESVVDEYRTGSLAPLKAAEDEIVKRIEDRLADVSGTRVIQGEPIQVINYGPGEQYKPHFDWFDPRMPSLEKHLKKGGQRAATVIMYLNTPAKGGKTDFPNLNASIPAVAGDAVLFHNLDSAGKHDIRVLHAGLPPEEGEKWIATRWIRERAWDGSEEAPDKKSLEEEITKRKIANRDKCAAELRALLEKYDCDLLPTPYINPKSGAIMARVEIVPL